MTKLILTNFHIQITTAAIAVPGQRFGWLAIVWVSDTFQSLCYAATQAVTVFPSVVRVHTMLHTLLYRKHPPDFLCKAVTAAQLWYDCELYSPKNRSSPRTQQGTLTPSLWMISVHNIGRALSEDYQVDFSGGCVVCSAILQGSFRLRPWYTRLSWTLSCLWSQHPPSELKRRWLIRVWSCVKDLLRVCRYFEFLRLDRLPSMCHSIARTSVRRPGPSLLVRKTVLEK